MKYMVVAKRHSKKGIILSKSAESIQKARAIGRKAILEEDQKHILDSIEVYIAKATDTIDKNGIPDHIYEVLMHRFQNHKIFIGIMTDRMNVPGVSKERSLMMVNADGTIWYDPTIWS